MTHPNPHTFHGPTSETADIAHRSEIKTLTHDGYIWPVPRPSMRDPAAIIERMADDFAKVVKCQGTVSLSSFGWLPSQLVKHRASAVLLYKQRHEQSPRFAAIARSFAADAAELACLALFLGMVGTWSIILGA